MLEAAQSGPDVTRRVRVADMRGRFDVAIETSSVTPDRVRAELDQTARERFNLTGEEFLERYRTGALDLTAPAVARVAILARIVEDCDADPVDVAKRRTLFGLRTATNH